MLIAWSVTEVVRYSYFVFTLSGYSPGFISWLRYNTFYVLYPLGISSECWLIYKAIAPAKEMRQEYAWALQLILLIYVPGRFSCLMGEGNVANWCRIVYFVHAYDGSEKESYEGEAGAEDGIDTLGRIDIYPWRQKQCVIPSSNYTSFDTLISYYSESLVD